MFVFKNFCLKFICLLQDDLKTQSVNNNNNIITRKGIVVSHIKHIIKICVRNSKLTCEILLGKIKNKLKFTCCIE